MEMRLNVTEEPVLSAVIPMGKVIRILTAYGESGTIPDDSMLDELEGIVDGE